MGVYATFADVEDRYEGEITSDRETWIERRIDDVEAELIGLVPALAGDVVKTTDPARAGRVRRLICDKVLALFRNPDGAVTVSNTMGPFTNARTLSASRIPLTWLTFTPEELANIGYLDTSGSVNSVPLRSWSTRPRLDQPVQFSQSINGGGP